MSNIRAITGSTKIMNRPTHGGSKKQGIPSSTNLNTWSHVAFRNRNVVCACNRHIVFCMNQLGGVGAGGVPGNSYMFAPSADGVNKNKILYGINHKNIRHPSQFELKYTQDTLEKANNPLQIYFTIYQDNIVIDYWAASNYDGNPNYPFITNCFNSGSGYGSDVSCYNREVVGNVYGVIFVHKGKSYQILFSITGYIAHGGLSVKFLSNPSSELLNFLLKDEAINIIKVYKSTYKINV